MNSLRTIRVLQFAAIVLTALALVPGGAHVASLPNKIDLAENNYFIVQMIYNGWSLFGIVIIAAIVVNLALAVVLFLDANPANRKTPFRLAVLTVACLAAGLAIFFLFTFPANVATDNWTTIPDDWRSLRWQWEISHAVNAALTFLGFCTLTASALTTSTTSESTTSQLTTTESTRSELTSPELSPRT